MMRLPGRIVFPKDLPAEKREAHRRLTFSGTYNFRDLGGYAAADGRHVKWGVLYRSDKLQKLTNHDLQVLAGLNLYCVIDLRADFEREKEPDRLPDNTEIQLMPLPIVDTNSTLTKEATQKIVARKFKGIDSNELLIDAYKQFVTTFTPQYRTFFRIVLAAEGKPILFHCKAGKDRTGFAAALLLRILGVSQQVVLQDYLLTQRYMQRALTWLFVFVRFTRGKKAMQLVQQLTGVKEEFLKAAFDTIDVQYGSFDAYIHDGLGLSDNDVETLRSRLTE
jgi:protein-tyrosine phosphatase